MRIVAGAVINAAHGHPEVQIGPQFARSVAKRAAGTLTAQWPDVLALPAAYAGAPEAQSGCTLNHSGALASHALRGQESRASQTEKAPRGKGERRSRPSLRFLHNALGNAAMRARREGDAALLADLRTALRAVGAAIQRVYCGG